MAGLAVALAIRAILFPRPGLAGDVEDFLAWAQWIQSEGLGRAYDAPISFPPVMPLIWWVLGIAWPGLPEGTVTDVTTLAIMKLPATLADVGLAAGVGYALRARPRWAVAGALAVLLHPAAWYVSAWWVQFEPLYVLPMLVGWILVVRDRPHWAAVAIAVGLMTKPQALPLAIPFAAYYLRRYGPAGSIQAGLVAVATAAVLWLPFLPADGLGRYVEHLRGYTDLFAFWSLRAWNPWWVFQDLASGGRFVADDISIVGPVTMRWVGVAIAAALGAVVFSLVWRRATPTGLAWGLAAACLAAFVGLTEMHERYSYPALVFLVLCWPNRRAIGTWVVLAVAVGANLVAAVPPDGPAGSVIPVAGPLGIAGSIAISGAFVATLVGLRRREEPGAGGGAGGLGTSGRPGSA